ncbi:unnamed protein product [Calypogeia fissa]
MSVCGLSVTACVNSGSAIGGPPVLRTFNWHHVLLFLKEDDDSGCGFYFRQRRAPLLVTYSRDTFCQIFHSCINNVRHLSSGKCRAYIVVMVSIGLSGGIDFTVVSLLK